ncbi:hypothetical protein PRIPAC_77677 [Pristionchus pacificus]|nr:hypothetical protein PRIPAC_77677 [Pristionchus pacificus]
MVLRRRPVVDRPSLLALMLMPSEHIIPNKISVNNLNCASWVATNNLCARTDYSNAMKLLSCCNTYRPVIFATTTTTTAAVSDATTVATTTA